MRARIQAVRDDVSCMYGVTGCCRVSDLDQTRNQSFPTRTCFDAGTYMVVDDIVIQEKNLRGVFKGLFPFQQS